MHETQTRSGVGDFDFLVGTWDMAHRRLTRLLQGSTDWEEFQGTSVCHSFFDGAGSFDTIQFDQGWMGMSVRLFDPEREEWTIYWANSRTGLLQAPVVGRFADGRGEFYGDDTHDGTLIRARYLWTEITPTSARWEQAFSVDGEQTWETNWIVELSRTGS
jgi:hypothetical protein